MKTKKGNSLIQILIATSISLLGVSAGFAGSGEKIPYPSGYDTTSSGASSYQNSGDHKNSPYFKHPDFYNMKSNDNLTLISGFKTYQQTTEWSCGPSAALMVLNHYGNTDWDELTLGKKMNSDETVGTSTDGMVKFFDSIKWDVKSSLGSDSTFDDPEKFKSWVIDNLKENTPIMVEWIDWGGHWQDIIGYDTMGTDGFGDDVLILADPYDTSDHLQDGYYSYPAERFFYMWFDAHMLPENQKNQQWLIAKPNSK